jgi:hypothetical protein
VELSAAEMLELSSNVRRDFGWPIMTPFALRMAVVNDQDLSRMFASRCKHFYCPAGEVRL